MYSSPLLAKKLVPTYTFPIGENAQRAARHYANAHGYHQAASPGGMISYQLPERLLGLLRPFLHQNDRVLDLGCGSGHAGLALHACGQAIALTGVDCSEPMLSLAQEARYGTLCLGDIPSSVRGLKEAGRAYEWAVAIGSPYYLDPEKLAQTMDQLLHICRRGICLSLESFSPEFIQAVRDQLGDDGPKIYDHSSFFDTYRLPPEWKLQVEATASPAWISPSTGMQIHAKLALLHRIRFPRSI